VRVQLKRVEIMRWFSALLITVWLITITIDLTSQSEILIIRHGRSRSRHSVEKEHVRWGLKALDNLTIVDSHDGLLESAENGTNGELSVVSFYENNGTLTQSNEYNGTIGSFEINYTHGPSKTAEEKSIKRHYHEWYHQKIPPTAEIPKSALTSTATITGKRRGGRKKEIMTDIKSTVNKGIQYLKSHENLDEIEIEINDYNTKRTAKSNKIRSKSIAKADQTTTSMLIKGQQQQQQHKIHSPRQIKINGGKELGIVTIVSSEPNGKNKILSPVPKLKKSNGEKAITQRHAAAKHIKNHQVRNQIDANINSNLADVFYIPTSTEENPFHAYDVEERMQGDSPAGTNDKIENLQMENSNQRNEMKSKKKSNKKNEINSTVASIAHQNGNKSNKAISDANSDKVSAQNYVRNEKEEKTHSNLHSNMPHELTISSHDTSVADKNRHEDYESNQQNDEINNDEANEDFINTIGIQNDDVSNNNDDGDETNSADFDGGELEEGNTPFGIYHVEDLDLSDFDETSRNNRKNLMRGRDVVTRFLQIVESQHVLGGNCTAGTALNLGEGVVDRYAQDRFRVEAEVAVNRANMLTR
jgi:hypothetical protein